MNNKKNHISFYYLYCKKPIILHYLLIPVLKDADYGINGFFDSASGFLDSISGGLSSNLISVLTSGLGSYFSSGLGSYLNSGFKSVLCSSLRWAL